MTKMTSRDLLWISPSFLSKMLQNAQSKAPLTVGPDFFRSFPEQCTITVNVCDVKAHHCKQKERKEGVAAEAKARSLLDLSHKFPTAAHS